MPFNSYIIKKQWQLYQPVGQGTLENALAIEKQKDKVLLLNTSHFVHLLRINIVLDLSWDMVIFFYFKVNFIEII